VAGFPRGESRLWVRQEKRQNAQAGLAAYLEVETERAADVSRLSIVHVSPHSRQRHTVLAVIALAIVSTRLPRQNGNVVGRVTSLNSDPDIVAMLTSAVSATNR
jgi:hypothetical protein